MTLQGKVVVVTGAARGVGAELARQLAARGAHVALLGLEPALLQAVSAQCVGSAWWEVDVTDEAALRRVGEEVVARLGGVDVVVANAGIATGGPLLHADPVAYDRVIEVNLLGSVRTVRALLPHVVARRGYVLQIASTAALLSAPMMSAYTASKAGVEAFAHALQKEVAHHGVAVGVGYLHWTDTDMVRGGDAVPGLGELRSSMPWPFRRTHPLEPAVARIVDGIDRRLPAVHGQRWTKALVPLRGAFPALVRRSPVGDLAAVEAQLAAAGPVGLVGAGGAADEAARRESPEAAGPSRG